MTAAGTKPGPQCSPPISQALLSHARFWPHKVTCPYHCQWEDESSFSAEMQDTSLTEGAMKAQIHKDFTNLVYQTREKRPESTIK